MSDKQATEQAAVNDNEQAVLENADNEPREVVAQKQSNQALRTWTLRLVIAAMVLWGWHLFADRITPYTDHARVRTFVTPIAPLVSGKVVEVGVDFNQPVKRGDLLFKIEQNDYQIALQQAQAGYEQATQNIGASGDDIVSEEARLAQVQANLEFTLAEARRYKVLAEKGVISQSERDKVEADVKRAQADVAKVEADLQKMRTRLGEEGLDNPRVRQALAALKQAQINLERTEVRAPADGAAVNAVFSEGMFANKGQPLMTFLDTRFIWVEAYLTENNLGNLAKGNEVEILLDTAPGRVFKGEVVGVTYGVNWNKSGQSANALPTVNVNEGWMRDVQRFPVTIAFKEDVPAGMRLEGGQADVVVYTGGNFVLNGLAWLQIRLGALMSYLR